MRRLTATTISAVLLATLLIPQRSGADPSFDEFCKDVTETFETFYPVKASRLGRHSYDSRLADFSSRSVKDMINRLKQHHKELRKFRENRLTPAQRINARIVAANLDEAILHLDKIKWHRKAPVIYVDQAIEGIHALLVSRVGPLSERLFPILDRMKEVPSLFSTARKNIKSAPLTYIAAAREKVGAALEMYSTVAAELMKEFPDRADDLLRTSTSAREALTEFDHFLADLEVSEADQAVLGEKDYVYLLEHGYLVSTGLNALLSRAEESLTSLTEEYVAYLEYIENQHQNGTDSVFVPASFSRQDVIDYFAWEVDQARLFLAENDFVSLPVNNSHLEVRELPLYLRSLYSSTSYESLSPFDASSKAVLYVRPIPSDPDDLQVAALYRMVNRRGFRDRVVSQAFPGRHLQMLFASLTDDPLRKWQQNGLAVEGWALYCSEEMYRLGLFGSENPSQWLTILRRKQTAAALAVAEIKVHTRQWTVDDAVIWLMDVLSIDSQSGENFARDQVEGLTYRPGKAAAGWLGLEALNDLRDAFEESEGNAFEPKAFHDAVLTQGAIPPSLLWVALRLK